MGSSPVGCASLMLCPGCGTPNRGGAQRCIRCGANLVTPSLGAPKARRAPAQPRSAPSNAPLRRPLRPRAPLPSSENPITIATARPTSSTWTQSAPAAPQPSQVDEDETLLEARLFTQLDEPAPNIKEVGFPNKTPVTGSPQHPRPSSTGYTTERHRQVHQQAVLAESATLNEGLPAQLPSWEEISRAKSSPLGNLAAQELAQAANITETTKPRAPRPPSITEQAQVSMLARPKSAKVHTLPVTEELNAQHLQPPSAERPIKLNRPLSARSPSLTEPFQQSPDLAQPPTLLQAEVEPDQNLPAVTSDLDPDRTAAAPIAQLIAEELGSDFAPTVQPDEPAISLGRSLTGDPGVQTEMMPLSNRLVEPIAPAPIKSLPGQPDLDDSTSLAPADELAGPEPDFTKIAPEGELAGDEPEPDFTRVAPEGELAGPNPDAAISPSNYPKLSESVVSDNSTPLVNPLVHLDSAQIEKPELNSLDFPSHTMAAPGELAGLVSDLSDDLSLDIAPPSSQVREGLGASLPSRDRAESMPSISQSVLSETSRERPVPKSQLAQPQIEKNLNLRIPAEETSPESLNDGRNMAPYQGPEPTFSGLEAFDSGADSGQLSMPGEPVRSPGASSWLHPVHGDLVSPVVEEKEDGGDQTKQLPQLNNGIPEESHDTVMPQATAGPAIVIGSGLRRCFAMLIDAALVIALTLVPIVSGWFGPELMKARLLEPDDISRLLLSGDIVEPAMLFLCFFTLLSGLIHMAVGASPGKLMAGLKVIDQKTGKKISVPKAWIRTIVSLLSLGFLGAGYAWILIDGRKRTWHDLATGSLVVLSSSLKNR